MLVLQEVALAKSRYDITFPSLPAFARRAAQHRSTFLFITKIYPPPPKSMRVHKPSYFKFIQKKYGTDLNHVLEYIETGCCFFLFPFSFESDVRRSPPAPRVAARASLMYRSTSFSSAPRYCTVVLRLALGAPLCTHSIFVSRTLRRYRSKYRLKAISIKNLHPHFIKYQTRIAHRSQRKISTRQRALGKSHTLCPYTHPPEAGIFT